jgi:hypothetical protein
VLILIFCFDDGDNDDNYYRDACILCFCECPALFCKWREEKNPTSFLDLLRFPTRQLLIALPGCLQSSIVDEN